MKKTALPTIPPELAYGLVVIGTCDGCAFYHRDLGQCRIEPPYITRNWPTVAGHEWCGRWRSIELRTSPRKPSGKQGD
jgi:hypothetical protein